MSRKKTVAIPVASSLFAQTFADLDAGDRLRVPGRADLTILTLTGFLDGRSFIRREDWPKESVGPVIRFCVEIARVDGQTWRDHIIFRPTDVIPEGVEVIQR